MYTKTNFSGVVTSYFLPLRRALRALALLLLAMLLAEGSFACQAPSNGFCVDYYKGTNLSGKIIVTTKESSINHSWGSGSPQAGLPSDNFSGVWRGRFVFAAGRFIFTTIADDGVRLKIDGQTVIDGWRDQPATTYQASVDLAAGEHLIQVEYYEKTGQAFLSVSWEQARVCDIPVGQFCAAYYDNGTLGGNPKFIAHEASIIHDWGSGSPDSSIPVDNFSGRWQGDFDFSPGLYELSARADDGVRLLVDGQAVIVAWVNQAATSYRKQLWLSGRHRITVEYFEAWGGAVLQAGWSLIDSTPNPTTAPIGSNARSPLGINLSSWNDWSTEQPFIDLFKTSRAWITQAPGVWDTGEESSLDVNANGWVRSLPPADSSLRFRSVATLVYSGPPAWGAGAEYTVLYDGEGSLEYGVGAVKNAAKSASGKDVITVDQNLSSFFSVTIAQTDPNHTGNYLRNIRVAPPGVECDDDPLAFCATTTDPICQRTACRSLADAVADRQFHPLFLRTLVYYKSLRFMQSLSTNVISSDQPQLVNWSDRSTPAKARWSDQAGVPVETVVALSNQMQADPWVNMPHRASDDYIRQFARLMHATLSPNLKVYVEYGNEIWNSSFSAGAWVEQQGLAAWPNAPDSAFTKRINWYGKRAAESCDIWRTEWAGDASRLVCVMAGQAANTFTVSAALDCSLWDKAPCQAHGIGAVAIAPYFGHYLGLPGVEQQVAGWSNEADGGLSALFAELEYGGQLTGSESPTGALSQTGQWVTQYAALARSRNLSLLAYEGGQHLVGALGVENDQKVTDLFVAANRDARMGQLYGSLLKTWSDAGGGLFLQFSSTGSYGKFGSWGALEHMGQSHSPKADALIDYIVNHPK